MNKKLSTTERLALKFKGINDFIEMGLMEISKDGKIVKFPEELWNEKNKSFKKNWCRNIYMYCFINHKNFKTGHQVTFIHIYNINNNSKIVAYCTGNKVVFSKK